MVDLGFCWQWNAIRLQRKWVIVYMCSILSTRYVFYVFEIEHMHAHPTISLQHETCCKPMRSVTFLQILYICSS